MIKELQSLLEKYKNQKNNELNYKINVNKEEIYLLKEENKKLEKANNELMQQIEKKDIYLNKIQKDKNKEKVSINSNLEKEIDLLKKDKKSLFEMINQIKTDLNKNKEEYEKKIIQMTSNFERIKSEKEKIEKIYYENKIKESEQNLNLLYKEIEELRNKNNILLNRNNSEKNKSKENSIFKNLIIEKTNKIIIRGVKYNEIKMDGFNKFKGNDEFITDNQYITNYDKYNNNINKFEESSYDKINIQNLDMLMLLYNKSKQIEKYINVESDEKNNEL
jgi:chromosome segregation ATPase